MGYFFLPFSPVRRGLTSVLGGIFLLLLLGGCSRELDLREFHPVPTPIAEIKPPPLAMEHKSQPVAVVVEPVGDWRKRRVVEEDLERILSSKPFVSVVKVIEGRVEEAIKKLPSLFPTPKYLVVIRHISSQVGLRCDGPGCPRWVTSPSQLPYYIQTNSDIPPEVEVIVKGKVEGNFYALPEMKRLTLLIGECREVKAFPYLRDYSREIGYKISHRKSKKKIYFYRRPPLPDLSRFGCLSDAVYDLSKQVWRELAPLGYVMEIRRNSDGDFVAKVNLGENDGVEEGQKVIFYHLTKTRDPLRQKEIVEWHKIGEGEISNQVGSNFSWVWIDDHTRLPEVGDIVKPLF
ncbi:MAG: hypothetical protein C6I01_01655 [Epsilonproteobacteria bacterium]|nr:hypothetical protein [Campylobacterota bacterium]NPA89329.1 hypothetical protein [Campylobacterota bacterium]